MVMCPPKHDSSIQAPTHHLAPSGYNPLNILCRSTAGATEPFLLLSSRVTFLARVFKKVCLPKHTLAMSDLATWPADVSP